jgi:hypothetical protein
MYIYATHAHTHTRTRTHAHSSETSHPPQVDVPDDVATVAHLIKWSVANVCPPRPRFALLLLTLRILRSWPKGPRCSSSVTTCEMRGDLSIRRCLFPLFCRRLTRLPRSRAGILVLVNGADWELEGGAATPINDNDEVRRRPPPSTGGIHLHSPRRMISEDQPLTFRMAHCSICLPRSHTSGFCFAIDVDLQTACIMPHF